MKLPNLRHSMALAATAAAFALTACASQPATDSAPAPQATIAPQAAPATTVASNDDSKIICRSYDSTGSRVRRERVCMTAKEWRKSNDDAQEFAREMEKGGSTGVGGQSLQGN